MAAPDLRDLVPAVYLQEDPDGIFAAIIEAYQAVFDGYDADLLRLANLLDVEHMASEFVDALLRTFGNPFPTASLSLNQRRSLTQALISMYKLKGTATGIQTVCAFFGYAVVVVEHWNHCWEIGEGELGWNTWLSPDDETERPMAFDVMVFVQPPAADVALLRRVVQYMTPPECTFFLKRALPWDGVPMGWDDGITFWEVSYL